MVKAALTFCKYACGFLLLMPLCVHAYTSPGQPAGFVNDFSNLLSDTTEISLEERLAAFNASTTIEIAVVTVPSLDGESIETYANALFRDWGIGKKETNNGILLLIAPQERHVRIEVGYGLEGAMPDIQAGYIIDNIITPAFKQGAYEDGILQGVTGIMTVLQGQAFKPSKLNVLLEDKFEPVLLVGFIIIVTILEWFAGLLASTKSWWLGGIVGVVAGGVMGIWFGFLYTGIILMVISGAIGLFLDLILSIGYRRYKEKGGTKSPWSWGTSRVSGSGGRSGGFGGGSSGGGGASGSW